MRRPRATDISSPVISEEGTRDSGRIVVNRPKRKAQQPDPAPAILWISPQVESGISVN
jgi:hypothetical protein